MGVVEISRGRDREILDVLRYFVSLAERGKLKGLTIGAKSTSGKEEISVAGDYRAHPGQAVNMAMRMSWRLTQMQDDLE